MWVEKRVCEMKRRRFTYLEHLVRVLSVHGRHTRNYAQVRLPVRRAGTSVTPQFQDLLELPHDGRHDLLKCPPPFVVRFEHRQHSLELTADLPHPLLGIADEARDELHIRTQRNRQSQCWCQASRPYIMSSNTSRRSPHQRHLDIRPSLLPVTQGEKVILVHRYKAVSRIISTSPLSLIQIPIIRISYSISYSNFPVYFTVIHR